MSSIAVHVTLLSGGQKTIRLPRDTTVDDLWQVAQVEFNKSLAKLISESGTILPGTHTLEHAGVSDGDTVAAVARDATIAATMSAFALIRGNGSVAAWGNPACGGNCRKVQEQLYDVKHVVATLSAFAAIRNDGSVVTWGERVAGGDSSKVQRQLHDVCQIQATETAFAAVKSDGSVVTWGIPGDGGDAHFVQDQLRNVQQIQASAAAFAALREDGQVVTWGDVFSGGDSSEFRQELQDVLQIFGHDFGFTAIKTGGRIVCWGDGLLRGVYETGLNGVTQFQCSGHRWAAAASDGSFSLSLRSSSGPTRLHIPSGASSIVVMGLSLALLQRDGEVQFWGCSIPKWLRGKLKGVTRLHASGPNFAAIRSDGSVVTWSCYGNKIKSAIRRSVQSQLTNVIDIQSSRSQSFAALRADGSVVTWGLPCAGGDSSAVQGQLKNVIRIEASDAAFAAIRADGSVVSWGLRQAGGDCSHLKFDRPSARKKPKPKAKAKARGQPASSVSMKTLKHAVLKKPSKR